MDKASNSLKQTVESLAQNRQKHISIDGVPRDEEDERALNSLTYAVFHDANGQKLLNYLRQITLNRPMSPHVSDSELRHMEGMRSLFGLIYTRFEKGKNNE